MNAHAGWRSVVSASATPALTSNDCPVVARARSEARNTAASATFPSVASSGSAVNRTYACTGGPHIQPGSTVLTRIRYGPSSRAGASHCPSSVTSVARNAVRVPSGSIPACEQGHGSSSGMALHLTERQSRGAGGKGVRPGHALITMVEPHPGHEHAYNRWYEDDHYYAGAMAMPWMYAGRRPRDFHALDHPYAGPVLEVIDTGSPEQRPALLEWLRARHLPRRLAGSPAAMVTVFRPTPLPGDRMTHVRQVEGVDTRLTLLWFLERDPPACWEEHFTGWSWWRRSSRRCRAPTRTPTGSADRQGFLSASGHGVPRGSWYGAASRYVPGFGASSVVHLSPSTSSGVAIRHALILS